MEKVTITLELYDVVWQSDWCGEEVGYEDVDIVSLYTGITDDGFGCGFYIDEGNQRLLEFWLDRD